MMSQMSDTEPMMKPKNSPDEVHRSVEYAASLKIQDRWLGLIDIKKSTTAQTEVLKAEKPNEVHIFGCEHFEVLSAGKSLWKTDLSGYQKHFESIDLTVRGGQLTLHNPSQLIIYPVLNLSALNLNLRSYINLLLSVSQNTFLELGLNCDVNTEANIGIYSSQKKLLSLGLHHTRGWVSHGLSINVSNDLTKFSLFDICGIASTQMTSLKNLNIEISTKDLFSVWLTQFKTQIIDQLTLSQQINT